MEEKIGFGLGTLIIAFVGGATAGAVAALLTAPESGAQTRKRLAGIVGDSRDRLARVPAALRHAASEVHGPSRDALVEVLSQVKEAGKNDRKV